jgi:hypothetical protein
MFGKPSRESKPEETPETKVFDPSSPNNLVVEQDKKTSLPLTQPEAITTESEISETSELVNTVEKISRIIAPYFIAIAGLVLYEDNFLLGTILIGVGILALLKVSTQDVAAFLEWFKSFLGFGETQ